MKLILWAVTIILSASLLIAQGKQQAQQGAKQTQGFRYRDILTKQEATEWKKVQVAGFSLTLPYSNTWKISGIGLSVFDVDTAGAEGSVLSFGKPIDAGTYIAREYRLVRFPARKLQDLKNDIPPPAQGIKKPELLTVEGKQCLKYYEGGAKGASLVLACNVGTHTYLLYKSADMGTNTPEIDNEIKILITGLR